MGTAGWLLLTDYSSKYRVSVSTLRRRIKAEQIRYRFDNGKYFIFDAPPPKSTEASSNDDRQQRLLEPEENRQVVQSASRPLSKPITSSPSAATILPIRESSYPEREKSQIVEAEKEGALKIDPFQSTATVLINELKRAYTNVLQEKEEHIIQLKEEVTDLKTLVRVLEQDNARLRDYFSSQRNM